VYVICWGDLIRYTYENATTRAQPQGSLYKIMIIVTIIIIMNNDNDII